MSVISNETQIFLGYEGKGKLAIETTLNEFQYQEVKIYAETQNSKSENLKPQNNTHTPPLFCGVLRSSDLNFKYIVKDLCQV